MSNSRLYFSIKTKDADNVEKILSGNDNVEFGGINILEDKLKLGHIVFIVLGGDKPAWDTGLVGIGELTKEPYDKGYEKNNFKVQVSIKILMKSAIKREDLVPYRDTYGIIGIAPITKWEPNQALSQIEEEKAIALMRAMLEYDDTIENDLLNLVGEDVLKLIKGTTTKMVEIPQEFGETTNESILRFVKNIANSSFDSIITPEQRKSAYVKWLANQRKDGVPYSDITIKNYSYRPEKVYSLFPLDGYSSLYEISKSNIMEKYREVFFNNDDFKKEDERNNRHSSCGMRKYEEFLKIVEKIKAYPHNRILYGAPGTGKSYTLNEDARAFAETNMERVTFHPAYSYAQFFGSFKPISEKNGEKTDIEYKFVPGPFLRVLLKALANPSQNYLLVIEEINRANVAAVFGDVFQLLDRKDGASEYPIAISDELYNYIDNYFNQQVLIEEYEQAVSIPRDNKKIAIPANMYIWATMNSADQGVQPMDTAFKRRWDFKYIGIDEGQDEIEKKLVQLKLKDGTVQKFYWNKLRQQINGRLSDKNAGVPEDKQLGPFFIPLANLEGNKFQESFENKVLMYLFEDAAQYCHSLIFGDEYTSFAKLLEDFKVKGATLIGNFSEFESDVSTADKDDQQSEQSGDN